MVVACPGTQHVQISIGNDGLTSHSLVAGINRQEQLIIGACRMPDLRYAACRLVHPVPTSGITRPAANGVQEKQNYAGKTARIKTARIKTESFSCDK